MAGEQINRNLNIYINDREVVNSLGGITREITRTRNEMRSLVRGSENYDSEVTRLSNSLRDLTDRQSEFRDELSLTSAELSDAQDNFSNLFSGIVAGDMRAIQAGLLGIRGSIVATTQAMWAFVATPVGAFFAALAGIGLAAKEWADYNDEVYKANQLTGNLTKLTGSELDNVRVKATSMAETFDQDYKEIIITAKALVKEFGGTYEEALASIEEGFIKGGAANEDFLESMREYPTFFASAGYSVSEFQNLVNTGIDLSIYQDKLPDAIKEFSLSINEQTKTVRDALTNAFGKTFTDNLLKGIKDGSISVKDALALVSEEAKRVGINAQQAQQLTADLFRGAGEDAGGALKIFEAVRLSIENQIRPLTEAEKSTKDLADSTLELAKAQEAALKTDGFERWKNKAIMALNSVKEAWYTMVSGIVNNKEDSIKQANAKAEANRLKDQETQFDDYMERRRKRLGDNFNWEKERAEHLADVIKRMNSEWRTEEENKSYELEISVIKNAKQPAKATGSTDKTADETKSDDDAAKKRAKELADAKKHSEDLAKTEADLQKQLLATKRDANDIKNQLVKDDYERERDILNTEYDRKIEDLNAKVKLQQTEIDKLNKGISSPKTSKEDLTSFKKQLADRIEIQKLYSSQLITIEQTRDLKLGALREKFVQKDIQEQEKANARALQNLQALHNNELSQVKTVEEAKEILKDSLSEKELGKIKTLEEARKALKRKYLSEEITLQEQHLIEMMARMQSIFDQEQFQGIELISPEERATLLAFMDEYAAKLAALGASKTENEEEPEKKKPSGLDLLGYTQEEWEVAFKNLDDFHEKLGLIGMGFQAVSKAYGMYSEFLAAGEKRTLQKFEADNRKKQNALNTQLEKGWITQEIYNARKAKAENELAKKKAELEYKQAKREKAMNIVSIIGNTAVGVSKALAQGGVLGIVTGALVAAFGLVQLATAIKQPLPDKNGYYEGGYTGDGNPRSVSTALGNKDYTYHKREYVIPEKVLFDDDPVMPNIMSYIEAKRLGKSPNSGSPSTSDSNSGSSTNTPSSNNSQLSTAVLNLLERNTVVLEKIEENGIEAFLVNDIPSAKRMRDKIKELTKLETSAKP